MACAFTVHILEILGQEEAQVFLILLLIVSSGEERFITAIARLDGLASIGELTLVWIVITGQGHQFNLCHLAPKRVHYFL